MLAAHPSFPANDIAGLIKLAREKPGSINYASAGVGNFSHLAMELFFRRDWREAAACALQGQAIWCACGLKTPQDQWVEKGTPASYSVSITTRNPPRRARRWRCNAGQPII